MPKGQSEFEIKAVTMIDFTILSIVINTVVQSRVTTYQSTKASHPRSQRSDNDYVIYYLLYMVVSISVYM